MANPLSFLVSSGQPVKTPYYSTAVLREFLGLFPE
jgi:hypothetical protein